MLKFAGNRSIVAFTPLIATLSCYPSLQQRDPLGLAYFGWSLLGEFLLSISSSSLSPDIAMGNDNVRRIPPDEARYYSKLNRKS
jgi:hypothetical protein